MSTVEEMRELARALDQCHGKGIAVPAPHWTPLAKEEMARRGFLPPGPVVHKLEDWASELEAAQKRIAELEDALGDVAHAFDVFGDQPIIFEQGLQRKIRAAYERSQADGD